MAGWRSLKLNCVVLASLLCARAGLAIAEPGAVSFEVPANPILPAFSVEAADGDSPVSLGSFSGKVVLLNFWATWCGPCVKEMPSLDRLQERYGPRGLVVLPVSQDATGFLTVKTFYRQRRLTHLGIYWDEGGKAFRRFGLSGLPTSYLVARDGKAVASITGDIDWTSPEVTARIERLLQEKAPGGPEQASAR